MPLEISEIGVRLAVGQPASPASPPASVPVGGGPAALSPAQMDELVERCVRRVLLALNAREAR